MGSSEKEERKESALFLFDVFMEAMRAEHTLKVAGFSVKTGAPPPQVRTGCDLAVGVDLTEVAKAEEELKVKGVDFVDMLFIEKFDLRPLQLTKLFKEVDYGEYVMVRCGNIKITYDKSTGEIVNISGGGCPDIPYLILKMVRNTLEDGPEPSSIGYSLCAYTLQKAYERALELWRKKWRRK